MNPWEKEYSSTGNSAPWEKKYGAGEPQRLGSASGVLAGQIPSRLAAPKEVIAAMAEYGTPALAVPAALATGPFAPVTYPAIGAAFGAGGSLLADYIRGEKPSLPKAAGMGVISAIPGATYTRGAGVPAIEFAQYAGKEGLKFAGGNVFAAQTEKGMEGQGTLTPTEIATAAAGGFSMPVVGYAGGKILGKSIEAGEAAVKEFKNFMKSARQRMLPRAEKLVNEGGAVDPLFYKTVSEEGEGILPRFGAKDLSTPAQRSMAIQEKNNAWGRRRIRSELGLSGDDPLTAQTVEAIAKKNNEPYQRLAETSENAAKLLKNISINQGELSDIHTKIRAGNITRAEAQPKLDALEASINKDYDFLNYEAAAKKSPRIREQLDVFNGSSEKMRGLESRWNEYERSLFEQSGNPNYKVRTLPELAAKGKIEVKGREPTVLERSVNEYIDAKRDAVRSERRLSQILKTKPDLIKDYDTARINISKARTLINEGVVEYGGSGHVNMEPLSNYLNSPAGRKKLTGGLYDVADMASTFPEYFKNPVSKRAPSAPGAGRINLNPVAGTETMLQRTLGPRAVVESVSPLYQQELISRAKAPVVSPMARPTVPENILRYYLLQQTR